MNKYMLFGLIIFYMIIVTYIVDITQVYTVTNGITDDLTGITEFNTVTVGSMIKMFFNLALFKVEGLPQILNFILFYPASAILVFMGIDIAKDIIPFT